MTPQQIQIMIQEATAPLRIEIAELKSVFYKNNFSSHQDFNKSCNFNGKLKVPSYDTLPSCEVGQIAESGGTLYICSATDVWTVAGTQT